jgi:hypothetical protein
MVAPEMPTGALVGQSVFGDQTHRDVLDAARVVTLGQGPIRKVATEVAIAVGAMMFGINEHKIDGPSGARVAEIVQGARCGGIAAGGSGAAWAAAGWEVTASRFHLRRGQLLEGGESFGGIGEIFAWFQVVGSS